MISSFNNSRNSIEKEIKEILTMNRLKNDNEEVVKNAYINKLQEYKKDMSY